jgi:4-hydroxybenzoate polyprenyltransferase
MNEPSASLFGTKASDLVRLARPLEWLKNVFVLMPAPFAIAAGASPDPGAYALGLAGFCLVTSGVYALNDVFDVEFDRRDPSKRTRPLAAGRVSRGGAVIWSTALFTAGVALVLATGSREALVIAVAYAVLNVGYCIGAKHIPLLDVFMLAAGFVFRIVFGCALLVVAPSNWLLLCSATLALFLALAKRRADLLAGRDAAQRPSLGGYNPAFLEHSMTIAAGIALFSYALYSMDSIVFVDGREFASLPFVAFGILEYLRLAHTRKAGRSPIGVLLRSPAMLATGLGWGVVTLWSVGFL